jgi:hypothetical protein
MSTRNRQLSEFLIYPDNDPAKKGSSVRMVSGQIHLRHPLRCGKITHQ